MGQFPLDKEIKQEIIKKESIVYFFAFTKTRKEKVLVQNTYFCAGIVLEEPSKFTKAPHKVKILKVTFGLNRNGCSEEDGRTLLNREIHLPVDSLFINLPILMVKSVWWI
jgi:alanine racemase